MSEENKPKTVRPGGGGEGRWTLSWGYRTEEGGLSSAREGGETKFYVNPTSVRVVARKRHVVTDTFGNTAVMPWYDVKGKTNVDHIDIELGGVGNVYYYSDVGKKSREALLDLYNLTLSPFWVEKDGVYRECVWELRWRTPVFGSEGKDIVVLGYILQPMAIEESAGSPWLPTWRLVFTIMPPYVRGFLEKIKRKEKVAV